MISFIITITFTKIHILCLSLAKYYSIRSILRIYTTLSI